MMTDDEAPDPVAATDPAPGAVDRRWWHRVR